MNLLKQSLPTLLLSFLSIAAGCSGLIIDPSIQSVEAGDFALAVSACGAVPGGGMDVCHVRAGTKIESSWLLVVPAGMGILSGEVNVFYKDVQKQYGIEKGAKTIEIPWSDLTGRDTWESDLDGEALALVLMRYTNNEGIIEIAKFRGIAKIVVTKEGYDRLPIDSGFAAWQTKCTIQYSTAGRGAVKCR